MHRFRFRFRSHLFQPHQADQMFDPHMTGSSYASKPCLILRKVSSGEGGICETVCSTY